MQITCMAKEFVKKKMKEIGEYHDLYLKSDTLLLAGVFENVRKMCLKVRELCKISFGYLISMSSNFKKDRSKTRIIN